MSSILNNSSFLFNPAGSVISYKEDKVYSVLPNDGAVDGVVSGNSGGGTRVNQYGYIEVTPANLNTYSEKFGNGYWNNFGGTITDDSVVAPNGTTTGTTYNGSPAGTYKTFTGIVPGQVYTVSMYVKLGTATNCVIIINNTQAWNTVGGKSFTSADGLNTTDWTRISFTFTGPAYGAINWHIGYHAESGVTQQTNGTYFVWGAMLNIGSTAKPYQPTTDRLGYPRIDYKSGKGKLLQEPQRTNVLTNSQDFNLTPHTLQNATVTTGSGISPDGTNNANKLISSGGTNTFYRWYDNLGALGGTYTYSIFAKADSGSMQYVCIGLNTDASNGNSNVVEYNIANGTVSRNPYGVTAYVEPYKDGWYRLVHTYNLGTAGSFVHPCIAISNGTATLSTFQNLWNSTAGQYVYLWGSQYEAGGFPTSYIPTTSATVTRAETNVTFNSPGPTKAFATKPGVILYDFDFYNFADGGSYETFLYNAGTTGGDYFYFAKLGTTPQIYWDGNNAGGYFYAGSFTPKQGKNRSAWYFTNSNSYWYVNGNLLYTGNYFDTTYFNAMQTYAVGGNNFAVNTFASIPNTSSISQAQVQAWTNFNSGSGGNISYYGPYTIHTFTGSATFTPSFNGEVEVLVVAGGGAGGGQGGNDGSGGGGAGGLLYASSYGVSAGNGITVTIGAGGAGVSAATPGNNGSNSVFGGLTAIGGGGGGSENTVADRFGRTGGSGGGAGGYSSNYLGGAGITGQGNKGGDNKQTGGSGINYGGGGGGGAGAPGQDGNNTVAGQLGLGGDGLPYSISGFSTYYAGGGGCGGGYSATGSAGGLGGGGKGGDSATSRAAGTSGVNYTGGGGGGAGGSAVGGSGNSGNGGAGVVIVRYLT